MRAAEVWCKVDADAGEHSGVPVPADAIQLHHREAGELQALGPARAPSTPASAHARHSPLHRSAPHPSVHAWHVCFSLLRAPAVLCAPQPWRSKEDKALLKEYL